MRLLLVVLAIVPACLPEPIYKVQRSARVPHPAAPLRSGAPLDAPLEASFGTSSALDLRAPRLANPAAAVETAGVQLRSELRIRLGTYGELHLANDHALDPSPIDRTQAPVGGDRNAWSFSAGVRYAIPVSTAPDVFIGIGLESITWVLPYVEYRSCVANCDGSPMQEKDSGTDSVWGLTANITPTYRTGDLTMFGGLFLAPHPTIVRKGSEIGAVDYTSDVSIGPYNYIIHAGVEYKLGPVSLLAQIQDDLTNDPISYGPSFGFAVSGRLMDKYTAPYFAPR